MPTVFFAECMKHFEWSQGSELLGDEVNRSIRYDSLDSIWMTTFDGLGDALIRIPWCDAFPENFLEFLIEQAVGLTFY